MVNRRYIDELKQHRLALSFILVLVAIRFIVVPWVDWQDELFEQTVLLQNNASRVEHVMSNQQELESSHANQVSAIEQIENYFIVTTDEASFRLDRQKWFEQLLEEHELSLNNIGWGRAREVVESRVIEHTLEVNLDGPTQNVVALMAKLQSESFYVDIRDMNVNFSRQTTKSLGRARVRLILGLYTLQRENNA